MSSKIDVDSLLAPIPGDNPAGADLRYSQSYEDIKEARRADDPLDRGAWQTEVKKADWDRVRKLAVETLTKKAKDLQIAAWLTEALITSDGFEGLSTGLKIVNGLLRDYWDTVYPLIEEEDLEFRAAPLEFMNEKLWGAVKSIAVTDPKTSAGYSWLKWQESREVGYEADTKNQFGDVDESKLTKRREALADGKLAAEDFDGAVTATSPAFLEKLAAQIEECRGGFKELDALVDDRFGSQGPRLAEIGGAIEDCATLVARLLKQKGVSVKAATKEEPKEEGAAEKGPQFGVLDAEALAFQAAEQTAPATVATAPAWLQAAPAAEVDTLWEQALRLLSKGGMAQALAMLLQASQQAPSVRERSRCRLLVAKLCLKAGRPDLARPIIEELYALMEELHLDRWESGPWIAEVIDTLYQCLTQGELSDEDRARARGLFERLCRTDITKAAAYRG